MRLHSVHGCDKDWREEGQKNNDTLHISFITWNNCNDTLQTWYLSDLLRQQIFQNQEIYPEKRVICDNSDPEYFIFGISIQRIVIISQFTSLYSHIIQDLITWHLKKKKSAQWNVEQISCLVTYPPHNMEQLFCCFYQYSVCA